MVTLKGALQYRGYRLYFSGQIVSLCGTWMQQIAMAWLVYKITGSALMLTATIFLSNFPIVLLGLWSGAFADRWNKKIALRNLQVLYMLQAILLCGISALNIAQGWHLLLLAALLGVINAFDIPLRQVFVASLVENKKDLPNAIALNSLMVNAARIVGPAIAGLILTLSNEAVCFAVNAVSYIAVIAAISAIDNPKMHVTKANSFSALRNFKNGWDVAMADPWIKRVLLMMVIVSLFASPYASLMPMVVRDTFASGANVYGYFMACSGVGALIAGLVLALRSNTRSLGRIVAYSVPMGGASLFVFSLCTSRYMAGVSLVMIGFSLMLAAISSNTLIQSRVPDAFRGRVMTLYSMALLGGTPLGSLGLGYLADVIGVSTAIQAFASIVMLLSGLLAYNIIRLHVASKLQPQ